MSGGTGVDGQVGLVVVEDSDSGSGGRTTCNLTDGGAAFRLSAVLAAPPDAGTTSTLYLLTTARRLDRETAAELAVTVGCHDGGRPPLSADATFNVVVLDENDNAPRFKHSTYTVGSRPRFQSINHSCLY